MADPQGMIVAASCATAFEWIGLPEGLYPLALATLYLATAPKSNSVGAVFKAMEEMQKGSDTLVPQHLRTSPRNRSADDPAYKYPHEFPNHWVAQQYLPDGLKDKQWYNPSDMGYETQIAAWLANIKKA